METKEIKIGSREIGKGHPTFIIAELSCNHLQDYDLAVKTIKAMKDAGADAVKLQTYTPDTITLDSDNEDFLIKQGTVWDGKTLHELYKHGYTPWEWFPKLQKLAHELGIEFFSSPFDESAVDFLEKLNVPAYKIASFEIVDIPLIKYAAAKGKPMIISTGVSREEDIQKAVEACRSVGNNQIILLKCTSAYPTPYEESNLLTIPDLAERFSVLSGMSDHTHGIVAPVVSVALGGCVIEKHFIIDREIKYPNGEYSFDRGFSLEPNEFKEMVENVRIAEKVLGKVTYKLEGSSKSAREFSPSLYVAKEVKKGEVWTAENVKSVRPGFGMHPEKLPEVLGKKATRDAKKGERMSEELVEGF